MYLDNFGLKGVAKNWSLENLEEDKMHKNIIRVEHNRENIKEYLNKCDKVIYGIGFDRREIDTPYDLNDYNKKNG